MAQGKLTPDKIRAKVIAMKLENPDMPNSQIAKIVGLDNTTVGDIVNIDIPKLPTIEERMIKLLFGHIEMQEKIQAVKKKRINTDEEKRKDETLDSWENTAFKTSQLLQGKDTEKFTVSTLSPDEQKNLLKILGK